MCGYFCIGITDFRLKDKRLMVKGKLFKISSITKYYQNLKI